MLYMRSWPHDGIQRTLLSIASIAASRSVLSPEPRAVQSLRHRFAIERDEPLRRRQEDHRVVAAPAVRIGVRERLAVPQLAALLQRRLDVRVRVEHALAAEQLHRVEEVSGRPDRRVDLQAVPHAGVEVVGAVARRGVHGAGAGLERHVVAEHAERRRARRADAGSGCARAPRPSSARAARRTSCRPAAATFGASASATITARPSTSYAA